MAYHYLNFQMFEKCIYIYIDRNVLLRAIRVAIYWKSMSFEVHINMYCMTFVSTWVSAGWEVSSFFTLSLCIHD